MPWCGAVHRNQINNKNRGETPMGKNIIVDSGCDMPEPMKKEMSVAVVPLTLMLGQTEFVDDELLDFAEFMKAMKACKEKVGSASPSPYLYQKAIQSTGGEYIITLSNKLSGSYSNAVLGNSQAQEDSGQSAHILDSKSASAGETLIAIKLHELIKEGLPKARIIEAVHEFIDNMKTYFVLENYDNLQKKRTTEQGHGKPYPNPKYETDYGQRWRRQYCFI